MCVSVAPDCFTEEATEPEDWAIYQSGNISVLNT